MPHEIVVDVIVPDAPVVDVASVGVQGPPGEPGEPGPAGPAGPQGPAGPGATGDIAVDSVALVERPAPALPAADTAIVYLQDNGAGLSQLMVQFATGAAVQLAIQVAPPVLPFGGIVSAANLVSYWKLDESSGTRVDSHGTNHLTPTNAPVGAAGKLGNGCDFERDSVQYLTHPDPTPLGDEDWTYTIWFKQESPAVPWQTLIAKGWLGGTQAYIFLFNDANKLELSFSGSRSPLVDVVRPIDTNWHFVVGWHDAAANTINLQLDGGAVVSVTTGGASPLGTGVVQFGAHGSEGFDGLIDEVGLWRRVLTAQERTDLYNGGAGLAY